MTKPAVSKHGATKGKLLLIGVLAVVLAGVIYWNYFRTAANGNPTEVAATKSQPSAGSSTSASPQRKGGAAHPSQSPPRNAGSATAPAKWPRFDLVEVLDHDPFALPEAFPSPRPSLAKDSAESGAAPPPPEQPDATAQVRAAAVNAIRQHGVQLVLRDGDEYVAKIGDQQVRVGDTIGGLRVVDISLRGVVLEGEASP